MTTNHELTRALDEAAKILANAKAKVGISRDSNNNSSNDKTEEQQKILELGRLTQNYEASLDTLNNYLPNVPAKDLKLYPDYYSQKEETASREIQEYEDMMAIAEANAAAAGLTNPKQEMAEFAEQCKQAYLTNCKQREERLKQIKTIIHADGTITEIDTLTGETARFDNQWNPLD